MSVRYETLRVGLAMLGEDHRFDLRLARADTGATYVVLGGALSEPFPDERAALDHANRVYSTDWSPAYPTQPCPICAAPVASSARYPRELCVVCVLEATDAEGTPLTFSNAAFTGALEIRAGEASVDDPHCVVRGMRCVAAERYFGGVVVVPE